MKKLPVGEYVNACGGDIFAGILLYHMHDLYKVKTVVHKGSRWHVRTRAELMSDTGLKKHQYDRGLSVLKALALIEVTHTVSWKKKPVAIRVTAFRLTEKARVLIHTGS